MPLVAALFTGVQAAVVAIVIEALIRVSKRALKTREAYLIALAAFLALFVFKLPFPLVILTAAAWGFLRTRAVARDPLAPPRQQPLQGHCKAAVVWLAIWLLPLAALDSACPRHGWPRSGSSSPSLRS